MHTHTHAHTHTHTHTHTYLYHAINYSYPRCDDAPVAGMWRGVTDSGRVGYFDPCKVAPYVDVKASPMHRKAKISRKGINVCFYGTEMLDRSSGWQC